MAKCSTNEFRAGLKVMLEGDPCSIIDNEFVKPGKGQAFSRVRLRNLKSGRVWERTFKSGESLEGADVMDRDMEYLYSDGEFWHFMEPDTYEQYQADANAVGDAAQWLKEQDRCEVTLYCVGIVASTVAVSIYGFIGIVREGILIIRNTIAVCIHHALRFDIVNTEGRGNRVSPEVGS